MQVQAYDFNDDLIEIQHQWANANYQLKEDEQVKAFEQLIELSNDLTEKHPKEASLWIWKGIVQSSFAGVKGGLGALGLVKKARKSFEKAMELDDMALQGSAYTSLGILYHKVPGWPLAFGDDETAKELLEKALKINESGIDPNYFYAEMLFDNEEYQEAKVYLNKALHAPARLQRPIADAARRREVNNLLALVDKQLGSSD